MCLPNFGVSGVARAFLFFPTPFRTTGLDRERPGHIPATVPASNRRPSSPLYGGEETLFLVCPVLLLESQRRFSNLSPPTCLRLEHVVFVHNSLPSLTDARRNFILLLALLFFFDSASGPLLILIFVPSRPHGSPRCVTIVTPSRLPPKSDRAQRPCTDQEDNWSTRILPPSAPEGE